MGEALYIDTCATSTSVRFMPVGRSAEGTKCLSPYVQTLDFSLLMAHMHISKSRGFIVYPKML